MAMVEGTTIDINDALSNQCPIVDSTNIETPEAR